jgi:D-galactarolactone isomerase
VPPKDHLPPPGEVRVPWEMIEPLSRRVNELGWHIQINAPAAKIIEIMPILERVPSPIVFDHLAHIPEPEGVNLRCSPRSGR